MFQPRWELWATKTQMSPTRTNCCGECPWPWKWCRNRGLATKNGITFVYVRPTKHGVHTTSYNHHHDLVGGAISILKNMSSSVWEGLSYIWNGKWNSCSKPPTSYDIPFIMVIYKSLLNPIKFLFVAGSKPPVPVIITGSTQPLQLGNKVWMKNQPLGIRR